MKILRRNVAALAIFTSFTYLSYSTFKIRSELLPYKDSEVLNRAGRGWIFQNTLYGSTPFIGIFWAAAGE